MTTTKTNNREVRHARIRAKAKGTAERPRLAVFRSNRFLTAQIINDDTGTTLASAHARGSMKGKKHMPLMQQATIVGELIAKAAKEKSITKVVFDRGGFTYAGRVKALADAARAGGLDF